MPTGNFSFGSIEARGFQDVIVASSVHKKENPLALLGQYSDDDEEDEGAADQPTGETKGSPRDAIAEVTGERVDTTGDKGDGHTEPSASVGDQQEAPQAVDVKNYTESVAEENTIAPEPSLGNDSATATEAVPDSSSMQIVGDIGGNWKAIMHEQSNQCYYWNTVTGETSWEMPSGLTSGIASDGVTSVSAPTHMDYSMEAQAHVLPHNPLEAYPSDVSVGNGTATYATFGTECGTAQITHDAYAYSAPVTSHGSMDIDPLQLAKYGEHLLQRLKLLERLRGSNEGLELITREISIRISDCNTLSSYGSSLLPLWLHAEVHLKELDSSISKLETSYRSESEPRLSKTDIEEHKAPDESDMTTHPNGTDLKFEDSPGVPIDEKAKVEEAASTLTAQNPQDMVAAAVPSKVELESDEDMDVEMEVDEDNVEEQVHSISVPNKEHPPSEKVNSPNLPSLEGPAPPEDNDVPRPPPEEEWIPPPPPDSEPAPPPPTEEPAPPPPTEEPAASYVHAGMIPQPYIDQANVGYTVSGIEYYSAGGTEGTNGNYYMPATEAHVLQAQQHSYYVPVSASGIAVPVDGVAPETYYTYPSATMDASGISAELSGYYASSVSAISSSAVDTKTSSASLVSANSDSDPTGSDNVISKDASVAPLSQAVVAPSATGTVSMLGSSTQASSTTNQSKVIRSKKRAVSVTSSLRSNKKVSSLVDKWKAAKEELRDEEEEPESALEALERKRQKEIEEWRKQQIASGEAKENANFVPIRGDWRDRVKRRRAEAKKELEEEPISLSSAAQRNGQPDLAELSKGLPSGWQAYLDESTKQVYYGNSLTSETTWERPTK
ncbi:hypothetical protein ACP70R_047248 [Stipagrostis hirtigluma subsp. patula]